MGWDRADGMGGKMKEREENGEVNPSTSFHFFSFICMAGQMLKHLQSSNCEIYL